MSSSLDALLKQVYSHEMLWLGPIAEKTSQHFPITAPNLEDAFFAESRPPDPSKSAQKIPLTLLHPVEVTGGEIRVT